MRVRALKAFISARYGDVQPGHVFECADSMAVQWMQSGMVEPVATAPTYNTKVITETPEVGDVPLASGQGSESGSSQAAPASRKRTRKKSTKAATE